MTKLQRIHRDVRNNRYDPEPALGHTLLLDRVLHVIREGECPTCGSRLDRDGGCSSCLSDDRDQT